jgi:hypothetical protein
MAGHYSPKQFVLQVPNPLLKTFFDQRRERRQIQWNDPMSALMGLMYRCAMDQISENLMGEHRSQSQSQRLWSSPCCPGPWQ